MRVALIASVLTIIWAAENAYAQQRLPSMERQTSSSIRGEEAVEQAEEAAEEIEGQGSESFEGDESADAAAEFEEDITAEEYQELLELPPIEAPYAENGDSSFVPDTNTTREDADLPFDVIGTDERQKVNTTTVFPARAVVLITMEGGRCSGFLYGKDVVATAGHCVHSGGVNGRWYQNVRVFAGRNGASAPYGSCSARQLHAVEGWTKHADRNHDYGVVKLNCEIGSRLGWFGYYWTVGSLDGTPSIISGYPGDKPLTQWSSQDEVRVSHDLKVFYRNDTAGGMSGSAAFHQHPRYGTAAFAIHTNGRHDGAPWDSHNAGTRIIKERFENMQKWRELGIGE